MRLTVVIISYNVKKLLEEAIRSVYSTYKEDNLQVIVADNASTDGSIEMVRSKFPKVEIVKSEVNMGFSAGNNMARKIAKEEYVLFLNSDVEIKGNAIAKCLQILDNRKELGAITCKVMLPNGKMDYSCHRGLPTVWNTFSYWTGLSKIFPKSSLFSGYTASYLDTNKSHYIDCITGAFLMVKKTALDKINWWDTDYWWNGEDIEFCYRLNKAGYKIWYEPTEQVIHYKGSSSGLHSTASAKVSKEMRIRTAKSAARAMKIFINKHQNELAPWFVMIFVKVGINLLEKYRLWKIERGIKYA